MKTISEKKEEIYVICINRNKGKIFYLKRLYFLAGVTHYEFTTSFKDAAKYDSLFVVKTVFNDYFKNEELYKISEVVLSEKVEIQGD